MEGMIFTIGHSNHSLEIFLELLRQNGVETIVDTRSNPRSKYVPQFDAAALQRTLEAAGIGYIYTGRELGGRPDGAQFYDADGRVLYGKVAQADFFKKGLEGIARLETEGSGTRLALLCAEENPSVCHRRLLIARVLAERGVPVIHIRADGRVETEEQMAAQEAAAHEDAQLSLFEHAKVPEWKSIPSVLPKRQPSASSD
jgi:uncharacterized protein (DUF488 family)